jgi:signal transduction histidine kinase
MKAGIGAQVASCLSAPEVLSEGYDRMLAVAQRLQLLVGVIALGAIWALPGDIGRRDQLTVTALLVGLYLPWTVLSRHFALLSEGAVARVLNLGFDLFAVSSFALVIPATRTAVMFAYALVIAYHSYVSGRAAGLGMCCACLVLVLVAEALAPPAERTDGFTLVLYGVVMVALAIMVDALAAERRRTARHLGRLYRALESVVGDPSLSATTDSIAEAARAAVGASSVAVFLVRDDVEGGVLIAGRSGFPDDAVNPLRAAVQDLARTPAGLAMRSGRPVSVPDVTADSRYAHLGPVYAQFDVAGLVSLPLGSPARPIGVLNAYFSAAHTFDEDDVHLLSAYARQASATVARALAFEQERKAAVRLADADRLKSDFVSTVSHELRTPLTSITGFVDTVLLQWDHLDDATKRELLERTAWNAAELRRLIDQVLAFSSLERTGARVDEVRPYDLGAGIADLVAHMAPALRDCPVTVDIEPGLHALANTETDLHGVGNLLTNAAKFSPAGSPITLVGRREGSVCRITVTDRGPGIAPEDRERIFDRFYRGSATLSTRGTGIGLSIVRASLERIGGTVAVRSKVGRGSTFEVTLPLADAPIEAPILLG